MDDKFKSYWASIKASVKSVWVVVSDFFSHNKFIFFVAIPLFILIKFRDFAVQFLTWKTDQDVKSDKKKSDILESESKSDNDQSEVLIRHAEQTKSTKTSVDVDWDKK